MNESEMQDQIDEQDALAELTDEIATAIECHGAIRFGDGIQETYKMADVLQFVYNHDVLNLEDSRLRFCEFIAATEPEDKEIDASVVCQERLIVFVKKCIVLFAESVAPKVRDYRIECKVRDS